MRPASANLFAWTCDQTWTEFGRICQSSAEVCPKSSKFEETPSTHTWGKLCARDRPHSGRHRPKLGRLVDLGPTSSEFGRGLAGFGRFRAKCGPSAGHLWLIQSVVDFRRLRANICREAGPCLFESFGRFWPIPPNSTRTRVNSDRSSPELGRHRPAVQDIARPSRDAQWAAPWAPSLLGADASSLPPDGASWADVGSGVDAGRDWGRLRTDRDFVSTSDIGRALPPTPHLEGRPRRRHRAGAAGVGARSCAPRSDSSSESSWSDHSGREAGWWLGGAGFLSDSEAPPDGKAAGGADVIPVRARWRRRQALFVSGGGLSRMSAKGVCPAHPLYLSGRPWAKDQGPFLANAYTPHFNSTAAPLFECQHPRSSSVVTIHP